MEVAKSNQTPNNKQLSIEGFAAPIPARGPNLEDEQSPALLKETPLSAATKQAIEYLRSKQLIPEKATPTLEDLAHALTTTADRLQSKKGPEISSATTASKAIAQVIKHIHEQTARMQVIEDTVNTIVAKLTSEVNSIAEGIGRNAAVLNATATNYTSITKEAAEINKNLADTQTKLAESLLTTPTGRPLYSQIASENNRAHATTATAQRIHNKQGIQHRQFLIAFREGAQKVPKDTSEETNKRSKDKITEALKKALDSTQITPEVRTVTGLNNGSILMELKHAETANWLKDEQNRDKLAKLIHPECYFKDRSYPLIARFVPISTDFSLPETLRDLEADHDLAPCSIKEAHWIRDPTKRSTTQTVANVKLTCATPEAANKLLTSVVRLGNRVVEMQKETKEPSRCNKCQHYGHFAAKCEESKDTCGNCGNAHRTSECKAETWWCVTCSNKTHPSTSRRCPGFLKRLTALNERNPEFSLPYFQTDEPWTWEQPPIPKQLPRQRVRFNLTQPGGLPPRGKQTRTNQNRQPTLNASLFGNPNTTPLGQRDTSPTPNATATAMGLQNPNSANTNVNAESTSPPPSQPTSQTSSPPSPYRPPPSSQATMHPDRLRRLGTPEQSETAKNTQSNAPTDDEW